MNDVLIGLLDFGLYNLWLWTLALNFGSSLILLSSYLKSKGTPIGRSAFYFCIGSFLWSIAVTVITIPVIEENGFFFNYFYLFFTFLAAITLSLGTYERTRMQILLTPGIKRQIRDNRPWFILSFCIFALALIGVALREMGGLTCLGFILIAGLFIALTQAKFSKPVYVASALLMILGFTVISGNYLKIPALYSPLPGGPTTVTIAIVFIIAGFCTAATGLSGLKWWIVKIDMTMGILFTVVIQFVAYFLHHPLHLSYSVLLLSVLVGIALLWRNWKTPNR